MVMLQSQQRPKCLCNKNKGNLNLDDIRFDDCWIHVLKHLPFKNRVLLERVSQKWKTLLMPNSDIHSFRLAELSWPESRRQEKEYTVGTNWGEELQTLKLVPDDDLRHVLYSALNRVGPYLQELDFKVLKVEGTKFRFSKKLMDFVVEKTPNLTKLKLPRCLLPLSCLPALLNLGKLEALDLDRVIFIEEDLSATVQDLENVKTVVGSTIQNLPSLKKLDLDWKVISPPVRNPNLTDLCVNGAQIIEEDVRDSIQHCPNLEVLHMKRYTPAGLSLAELGQLHNLRKLSLCFLTFSAGDLVAFSQGCPNMEKLHLILRDVQMNGFPELWRLPKLKSLVISSSCGDPVPLTDSHLASVANNGILETVVLPCSELTDDGLRNLAEKCPNLLWLDFHGAKGFSGQGVKHILEKSKHLEMLSLGDTRMMDPTLTAIGGLGCSLTLVNLQKTRVTGNGLRYLFEERQKRLMNGEKLVKLEVFLDKECPISQENLEAIFPGPGQILTILHFQNCNFRDNSDIPL